MRTPTPVKRGVRPPADHWVDRPEMEAPQGVKLTGTNRPSDLNTHPPPSGWNTTKTLRPRPCTVPEQQTTGNMVTREYPRHCGTPISNPPLDLHAAPLAGARRPAGCGWQKVFGGLGGGETPGPIPNPEVKPSSADGTARETVWESRTPPDSTLCRGLPLISGRPSMHVVDLSK